jgi:transcriptional regulator
MYNPPHFREERLEVLHRLIQENSLATFVTLGADGLIANHIPLILDPEPAPLGTLRGHLSRANLQWRDSLPGAPALAIFQGPEAYITPSWYPTRQETGRVVPTWNYVAVHAHGPFRTFEDPVLLEQHVRTLTHHKEAAFPCPWSVDDAPADFFHGQLAGIIGIEISITRLEGKWKVSQNRSIKDRAGVVEGLQASGNPADKTMADLVSEKDLELISRGQKQT